ncbi:MAG: lipopolysaccharide transporter permease LptF [Phycisphaerales bacterium]|nr:lipopolysaccharide transporter permease LptF [Phycisphaerales bacterium]MDB5300228.1 lipopolysaccharide transporter permease LptF [Phycisphaerales bacterium]
MSRTLFKYIFKDLFKIFMMASGALAGIMSFGGLLRPLTREGLDAGQVSRMLTYFTPAMTTYSFPVAALFATAVVYGRLSADNELTAFKASGISLLSLTVAGPALVLGLVVAIGSMLFLCFIVPASTLKVEKVIYSNLAKLVQGRIEREHQIPFEQMTIFAQEAYLPDPATVPPGQQQVVLVGPQIVSVERPYPDKRDYRVPKEFYTASRAIVYIEPQADGEDLSVTVRLEGGFKFPRKFEGAVVAGIDETEFGPNFIPSPIKEDCKFMDVWRLHSLYDNVAASHNIQHILADFVKNGQKYSYLKTLVDELNREPNTTAFDFGSGTRYTLSFDGETQASLRNFEISAPFPAPPPAATAPATTSPDLKTVADPVERKIVFRQEKRGEETLIVRAASVIVHARPATEAGVVNVSIDLKDCVQTTEARDGTQRDLILRPKYTASFPMPMDERTKAVASQSLAYFESREAAPFGNQPFLAHEKTVLLNNIVAESNGRASFAVSCLILVILGAALGMMFRSGNFLTAFAVSFIPALLSITLIVAGERTASHVSFKPDASNPLQLSLMLIWTGNAVNLVIATVLMWRLQKK